MEAESHLCSSVIKAVQRVPGCRDSGRYAGSFESGEAGKAVADFADALFVGKAPTGCTGGSGMSNPGALSDTWVLALDHLIAGPFCGQWLGEMGAEVVKL